MEKQPGPFRRFLWSTSTIVWVSALLVSLAMIAQGFALTLQASGQMTGVMLPHEALTWAFAVIASGYAGTDRIASFVRTQSMQYGVVDLGDPAKLRKLILITILLLLQGIVLSSFFGIPGLALDALATAFGGAGAAYVIGNKAVQAAGHSEGSHTPTEQPQFIAEGTAYESGK